MTPATPIIDADPAEILLATPSRTGDEPAIRLTPPTPSGEVAPDSGGYSFLMRKGIFENNAAGLSLGEVRKEFERSAVSGLDYPSFRMSLITKIIERMSIRQYSAHQDFSAAEWRVLCRICDSEDMTVSQIADRAMVDRAEVSRAAASLEKRGLLGRRDNPADRRGPLLFATVAGFAAYGPILESRKAFHEDILGNLSKIERDLLDALLLKVSDRLVEMAKD